MSLRPGLAWRCCCIIRVGGAWAEQGCGLLAESLESYRIAQGIEPHSEGISSALAVVLTDLGEPRALLAAVIAVHCGPQWLACSLGKYGSHKSAALTVCADQATADACMWTAQARS